MDSWWRSRPAFHPRCNSFPIWSIWLLTRPPTVPAIRNDGGGDCSSPKIINILNRSPPEHPSPLLRVYASLDGWRQPFGPWESRADRLPAVPDTGSLVSRLQGRPTDYKWGRPRGGRPRPGRLDVCRRRAAGTALLGLVTARHGRLRADYQTFRFLSKRTIRLSEAGGRRRRRDLCLQHCDRVAAKQKGPWSGENSELTSRVIIRANCAQLCISMFIEICPSSHAYISCDGGSQPAALGARIVSTHGTT